MCPAPFDDFSKLDFVFSILFLSIFRTRRRRRRIVDSFFRFRGTLNSENARERAKRQQKNNNTH